ncbi:hypothetical protein POVWA2_044940 [Plasmodium ovale wallikeri]|uniref:Uncharacterized protein n=1 Tax=Plasmodium ovale wallikeri TaxID=864142 RepID=A0A1A8ZFX1_PLAOA|nr:hypothetical protein POVWA1_046400 [Plasmodium ovale wallikeri]SBT42906.1 hypothetical protein POVWA2_044940 [Plasmodium ovale wallikeri]
MMALLPGDPQARFVEAVEGIQKKKKKGCDKNEGKWREKKDDGRRGMMGKEGRREKRNDGEGRTTGEEE